ncbi:MAG TPA: LacI family DNA-binding transcriptional regulator [Xanthobacteraceae bacterium]|jgi:LacI family transcriptional regulator
MIDAPPIVYRFMDARIPKEPTISDIAHLARVSIGTVSNVLNGRQSVREDLALRVTVAASKLGYRRNLNAASLRSNQTDTIAVAVPNIENAFFAEIVSMLEHLGVADRRAVLFLTTGEDEERARRQIYNLISRRIDGLILVPSFDFQPVLPELRTYGVPVVLLDRVEAKNPLPTVAVDNRQAGRLGGDHLFQVGYKQVAFFGHAHEHWILNQRREGFLDAARASGALELCSSYELSLDPVEIRETAARILTSASRPQAIFAASNIAAKGVIPAIQSVGLRIPEDIALLVMDDFEALSLLNPAISVIAQPSAQIAEAGWLMLRRLIADEGLEAKHVRLPAKLIVRGSTPPVPNNRKRR